MEIGLGILIVGGLLVLAVGIAIGIYLPVGKAAHSKELAAQLEASQEELADYRREVYDQFASTAEKFKRLDESYHDLHKQLATSAVSLIGDRGVPLLGVDDVAPSPPIDEEIVVGEATVDQGEATVDQEATVSDVQEPPTLDVKVGEAETVEETQEPAAEQETAAEQESAADQVGTGEAQEESTKQAAGSRS